MDPDLRGSAFIFPNAAPWYFFDLSFLSFSRGLYFTSPSPLPGGGGNADKDWKIELIEVTVPVENKRGKNKRKNEKKKRGEKSQKTKLKKRIVPVYFMTYNGFMREGERNNKKKYNITFDEEKNDEKI